MPIPDDDDVEDAEYRREIWSPEPIPTSPALTIINRALHRSAAPSERR